MSTITLPQPRTAETVDTDADLVECSFGDHLVPVAETIDCGDCQTTHCANPQCDDNHQIHHDGGIL